MRERAISAGRRPLLLGGASLAAALGLAACGDGAPDPEPTSSATPTPELPEPHPAEGGLARFGFHLGAPTAARHDRFREDLASVGRLGMGWARFAVLGRDVVQDWGAPGGPIRMRESALDMIDDAVGAARDAGLSVYVITNDAWSDHTASEDVFLAKMRLYWEAVARRIADRVDVWQVFNEADGDHYRTVEHVDPADAGYMGRLAAAVGAARDVIHGVGPDVRVTTNLFGYPVDQAMTERWDLGIAALAPAMDVITLDAYPQLFTDATQRLVDYIARARATTGKEVLVGEIGLQTCPECFSETDQAQAYALYIDALSRAEASAVLFYEPRDEDGDFGVLTADNAPKLAGTMLLRAAGNG